MIDRVRRARNVLARWARNKENMSPPPDWVIARKENSETAIQDDGSVIFSYDMTLQFGNFEVTVTPNGEVIPDPEFINVWNRFWSHRKLQPHEMLPDPTDLLQ